MIIGVKRTDHVFIRNGGIGTVLILDDNRYIGSLLEPWSFIGSSFPTFYGRILFRLDGIDEPFMYTGVIMFDKTTEGTDETAMIVPVEIPRFTKSKEMRILSLRRSLIPPCL